MQPKRVQDMKEFLIISRRKDVQHLKVKKIKGKKGKIVTKFKVRCSKYVIVCTLAVWEANLLADRYLYTLCVDEADKAEKLLKTLPPTVKVIDLQK